MASLVASSAAVAVRYGNVAGIFSGNEELVAGLMAECDGKHGGSCILVVPYALMLRQTQGVNPTLPICSGKSPSLPMPCRTGTGTLKLFDWGKKPSAS